MGRRGKNKGRRKTGKEIMRRETRNLTYGAEREQSRKYPRTWRTGGFSRYAKRVNGALSRANRRGFIAGLNAGKRKKKGRRRRRR